MLELKQLERDALKGGELWSYLPAQENKDMLEVLSQRLPDGSLLQVGKSMESRKEILERFRVIFAAIMVPVILIGFVLGALLATHVFRPVRQLTETIRSIIIDTSRVDARVPSGQRRNELADLSALFNSMLERIESLIAALRQSLG